MKKYFLVLFSVFLLVSCTRDEKIVTNLSNYSQGGYAIFKDKKAVITASAESTPTGIDLSNSKYIATIVDPNGNGLKYKLVSVSANIGGVDYIDIPVNYEYSFPANLSIPIIDLITAVGANVSDVYFGDTFSFKAEVTTKDGRVFTSAAPPLTGSTSDTYYSVANLTNPGNYGEALKFSFSLACPSFNISDLPGSYNLITDDWGNGWSTTVTVVAGPGADQVTLMDYDGSGLNHNLIVRFDSSGLAVVDPQTAEPITPYTGSQTLGTGISFSCAGIISLSLQHKVSVGTFGGGPYKEVYQKQ